MPHACRPADWLARHPEARAADLMQAFADPRIAAIVASIGGDDVIGLLPHLDFSLIAANPKIFLGFSDATVLHFACLTAGVSSFYGPTVMAGFAENGGMHAFARDAIRRVPFSTESAGTLPGNTEGWADERLDRAVPGNQMRRRRMSPAAPPKVWQGAGTVRGPLIGGCAEVLEMLKGTALWSQPSYWDGAILFHETSEEAPPSRACSRTMAGRAARCSPV